MGNNSEKETKKNKIKIEFNNFGNNEKVILI